MLLYEDNKRVIELNQSCLIIIIMFLPYSNLFGVNAACLLLSFLYSSRNFRNHPVSFLWTNSLAYSYLDSNFSYKILLISMETFTNIYL